MNSPTSATSCRTIPRKKRGRPKKGEGGGSRERGDVPPRHATTRSASPPPPMGTAPVLTRRMQTCLTRQLPTRLHCPNCMLSSDPVNCGANVAKWIGKNKENLPCRQLWVKENCLSLADRHQHELIIDILKDEIVVAAPERAPAPKRVALSPRKIGRPNRAATKPAPPLPSLDGASCVGINRGAFGPVIGYVAQSM